MQIFEEKKPITEDLKATLKKLHGGDQATLDALDREQDSTLAGLSRDQKRERAMNAIRESIDYLNKEEDPDGHTFHSRDPLAGVRSHIFPLRWIYL